MCRRFGNSVSSILYVPTFQIFCFIRTLCADVSEHCSIFIGGLSRKMEQTEYSEKSARKITWHIQCVSKRRHIHFRCRGITQKKEYNNDKLNVKHSAECYHVRCKHVGRRQICQIGPRSSARHTAACQLVVWRTHGAVQTLRERKRLVMQHDFLFIHATPNLTLFGINTFSLRVSVRPSL